MQRLKFRAWVKQGGGMIYFKDGFLDDSDCYTDTTMQYTGLEDIDGKEIYEGDLVHCQHTVGEVPYIQEIRFRCGGFCIGGRDFLCNFDIVKVVGNIYENPDWLETPIKDFLSEAF